MKLLLLGANGQVGHALRDSLMPLGELIVATRDGLLADGSNCEIADLDRPEALSGLIARVSPDVVVNAAAYTAVDRAEDEPAAAYRINAEAPLAIARACAARNALLVHYSTDYVFDGAATRPYREDDATGPLGVYGASKLAGEEAIRASGARHMIFRTAWVYAAHGRNFLRTMLRLAAERDELRVVADQIGTPTSAALIAQTTATILANASLANPSLADASSPPSGLWHLTAAGRTSWHGFAEAIVTRAHLRGLLVKRPLVSPIGTADYPTKARRPAYSCLDTSQLTRDFGIHFHEWDDDLERVLDLIR